MAFSGAKVWSQSAALSMTGNGVLRNLTCIDTKDYDTDGYWNSASGFTHFFTIPKDGVYEIKMGATISKSGGTQSCLWMECQLGAGSQTVPLPHVSGIPVVGAPNSVQASLVAGLPAGAIVAFKVAHKNPTNESWNIVNGRQTFASIRKLDIPYPVQAMGAFKTKPTGGGAGGASPATLAANVETAFSWWGGQFEQDTPAVATFDYSFPSRVNVTYAGTYLIEASLGAGAISSAGYFRLRLRKNGVSVIAENTVNCESALSYLFGKVAAVVDLAAGDYIEVLGLSDHNLGWDGGGLNAIDYIALSPVVA
jgi:hypothetical protein